MTENTPEKDPRAAEADGDDIRLTWRGDEYVIPFNYRDWPVGYSLEIEKGHTAVAMEYLLGPEQFHRFMAQNPTIGDFDEFDAELGKALRLGPGEYTASSD